MRERRFEYPCILDITKNCPVDCGLHQISVRQIIKLAAERGTSPEEEVKLLRSGTPEEINTLHIINASYLERAGLLNKCRNSNP